jgi:hypothetical protein
VHAARARHTVYTARAMWMRWRLSWCAPHNMFACCMLRTTHLGHARRPSHLWSTCPSGAPARAARPTLPCRLRGPANEWPYLRLCAVDCTDGITLARDCSGAREGGLEHPAPASIDRFLAQVEAMELALGVLPRERTQKAASPVPGMSRSWCTCGWMGEPSSGADATGSR